MWLAATDRQLTGWEYESKRLDVLTDVVKAFVRILGAQEKVKIAQETAQIALDVQKAAAKRVEVGDAPPVEQTHAEVVHAQVLTGLDRAQQELRTARIHLAVLWGTGEPWSSEVQGTLETDATLPPLALLRDRLEQNPELMKAAAEVVKRQAALDLERAKRVPDVSALAGYRRIAGVGVNTIVFGLSVPLPLFDRNQAAIQEAHANIAKAQWQKRNVEVGVLAALVDAHSELATTIKEQQAYRDKILPGARDAFRKTQIGYTQGTFDYLELLTAQETLAQTRADYVDVLVRLNQATAALERLVGEAITNLMSPPKAIENP
jgi:cobalt-zinc-cadmium efflux system outer membrane protein